MKTTDANLLDQYLTQRCQKILKSPAFKSLKDLTTLEVKLGANPEIKSPPLTATVTKLSLPLQFQNQTLGQLVLSKRGDEADSEHRDCSLQEMTAALEQFSGEISALVHATISAPSLTIERLIKLDTLVEEIALSQPDKFNWTGVYLLLAPKTLTLVAYRGERSPHEVIPIDRGICGAAVREEKTLNIADVHADSRYLSCSLKTKSEIVVPIRSSEKSAQKRVLGEIDIDSHVKNAFTADDEIRLSHYSQTISDILI